MKLLKPAEDICHPSTNRKKKWRMFRICWHTSNTCFLILIIFSSRVLLLLLDVMWSFFSRDPSKDFAFEIGEPVPGLEDKSLWVLHKAKKKVMLLCHVYC